MTGQNGSFVLKKVGLLEKIVLVESGNATIRLRPLVANPVWDLMFKSQTAQVNIIVTSFLWNDYNSLGRYRTRKLVELV